MPETLEARPRGNYSQLQTRFARGRTRRASPDGAISWSTSAAAEIRQGDGWILAFAVARRSCAGIVAAGYRSRMNR